MKLKKIQNQFPRFAREQKTARYRNSGGPGFGHSGFGLSIKIVTGPVSDQNRARNRLYTEPFLRIPGWFESPESQLSNHPGISKNSILLPPCIRDNLDMFENHVVGVII